MVACWQKGHRLLAKLYRPSDAKERIALFDLECKVGSASVCKLCAEAIVSVRLTIALSL